MKNTKASILAFLRVFLNLYYLGPWRKWFIRVAEYRHRARVLPVASSSVISGIEDERLLQRLRAEGFSGAFRVDPAVADEIVSHLAGDERYIVPEPHLHDSSVQKVVFDPGLQGLLHRYFGTSPYLFSTSLFITNPGGRMQNPYMGVCTKPFHYDLPDFKAVTLFVYLNDVDGFGGAHVVIPGTASRLTLHRLFSRFMSFREVMKRYGSDAIVTVTGPKGTAFLEDLVNWHKRSVSNAPRYALAATFTLTRRPPAGREPRIADSLLHPAVPVESTPPIRPLAMQGEETTSV